METIFIILISVAAFVVGAGGCLILLNAIGKNKIKEAEAEAELIKKNKIIESKEKFIALKMEHENMVQNSKAKLQQTEARQQQRELQLNQRQSELQRAQNEVNTIRENLDNQIQAIEHKNKELEKLQKQAQDQLETISGLSAAEAKKQLVESLKDEAKTNAMAYINEVMEEAKMTANKEAKKIVIQTIQRIATETAIENSVTVFHIDSDEVKDPSGTHRRSGKQSAQTSRRRNYRNR